MAKKKSDKAYFLLREGKDNSIELEVNGNGGELISMLVSILLENEDIQKLLEESIRVANDVKQMENEASKSEQDGTEV